MSRLTERDERGYTDIIGVDSKDFLQYLEFPEFYMVSEALDKLAEYEDICDNPEVLKEAREKQQGKKVDTVGNKCPVCKCYLASEPIGDRYCFNCGQKIMWEDDENG